MNRTDLLKTLKLAAPALLSDSEVVLPILKSFLFNGTHVIASNDVIAVCLATEVTSEGIVPGKKIISFLSACRTKETQVGLTKQNNFLVKCGSSRLSLPVTPTDEWPFEFPDVDDSVSFEVNEKFFNAIDLCSAQSPDTGLGSWSGGILFVLGNFLTIYGIGRGLSTVSHCKVKGLKTKNDRIKRVSVPSSFCKAAIPMAREFGSEAMLHINEDSIVLDWEDGQNILSSKLVNLEMPDVVGKFRSVVNDSLFFMSITSEFVEAIQRAATIGDKGSCHISTDAQGLRLKARSEDGATLNDLIKIDEKIDTGEINSAVAPSLLNRNFDNCQEIAFGENEVVMKSELGDFIYVAANQVDESEDND